jgi:flagellar hook-associated protein 3 FlgL
MIRVTHLGITELAKLNISKVNRSLQSKEEQAVSGHRINRPSDDPGAITELHRLYDTIEDLSGYQKNAGFSSDLLNEMDTALSGVHDILVRAREIATAMASGTYTAADRTNTAPEVQELYNSLVSLANTNTNGRYVFAGDAYQAAAFNAAGVYQGANTTPTTRVAENQWVQTGYDGSQVFQSNVDLFNVLSTFVTDLQTNNVAGIQGALTSLDTGTDQISVWRASIGGEVNASDDAAATGEGMATLLNNRLDSLLNIDQSEVYLDVSELRNTYEATLRVSATASQTSLFEML